MHYPDIIFEKGNTRGTSEVVIDGKGANSWGKFIWGGISGNRQYDLFKGWKDLDSHVMHQKRYLVWKIHEGFQA